MQGAERMLFVIGTLSTTKQHFHYFSEVHKIIAMHKSKSIDCAMCTWGMCSTELYFLLVVTVEISIDSSMQLMIENVIYTYFKCNLERKGTYFAVSSQAC